MKLPIVIKKKQALYPLYAVISAAMLCIALAFLFFPFIPAVTNALSSKTLTVYMVLGGVCTMFFAFTTSSIIFSIFSPPTAIRITQNGVYDYTVANIGAGFIAKDAILSLKTFGNNKSAFLGLRLDTKYLDTLSSNPKVRREINENTNSGLPAIIIKQADIRMPISELLKILLENYSEVSVDQKSKGKKPDTVLPKQNVGPISIFEDDTTNMQMKPSAISTVDISPISISEDDTTNMQMKPSVISAVDIEPISILEDDNQEGRKKGAKDEAETSISYKPFSLPSVDDEYTPILVNPQKPRVKTVDDLLAQLNITKTAVPINEEAKPEEKSGGDKD